MGEGGPSPDPGKYDISHLFSDKNKSSEHKLAPGIAEFIDDRERTPDPKKTVRMPLVERGPSPETVDKVVMEQLELYLEEAKRKGIITTEGAFERPHWDDPSKEILVGPLGNWFTVDGVTIVYSGEYASLKPHVIAPATGAKMPRNRMDLVGTYNMDSNMITYVDHEGRMRVAPNTAARIQALTGRNYKMNTDLYIVFSSGLEQPQSLDIREDWQRFLEDEKD